MEKHTEDQMVEILTDIEQSLLPVLIDRITENYPLDGSVVIKVSDIMDQINKYKRISSKYKELR